MTFLGRLPLVGVILAPWTGIIDPAELETPG